MTRTHAAAIAISLLMVLAIMTMAGCEGPGQGSCPPPIGCKQ